jgi:predicted phage tail component-like protein
MTDSIVRIPDNCAKQEFLSFSFNGKHSYADFGIIRTSEGDRFNESVAPTMNEKTAEVPGGDGMYYFGTTHKQRNFNISFAFDSLTETKLRELKGWLNGKEMGDLWFSEAPYKVWTAKPSGNATLKYLPFEEGGKRVYKGEGSIQFIAYWPYAHTPDYVVGSEFHLKADEWLNLEEPITGQYFYIESNTQNAHKSLVFYIDGTGVEPEIKSEPIVYFTDNEK